MAKKSVLIVEDSAFMRQFISNLLGSDPDLEVIGTAKNGKEGVELANKLKPDVITMDVEMPILDGISAVKQIMEQNPIPVVMLSSLTHEGAEATIRALEAGAIDFVAKPSGAISLDLAKVKDELLMKVKSATNAKARKVTPFTRILPPVEKRDYSNFTGNITKIIAIGTSTGGPKALQEVLPLFPKSIPAAILIVQHMPKGFTKSLAERLNSLSQVTVKEAEDGDILFPGLALIAPGDKHMVLKEGSGGKYSVQLTDEAPMSGHRPSVDMMFKSVAKSKLQKYAAILTGMGADGAQGILEIKQNGGKTVAQDEESCVVFGMPKVAIEKGAIDRVVPINHVSMELMKMI